MSVSRILTVLSLLAVVPTTSLAAPDRPNVLVVLADDCTFSDLPAYGGQNARTPHIDRLVSEGLLFERAYLAEAMCQPCRSELYSGQFPLRNGCAWNHSASRPTARSLPHYLKPLGYRVGLAGKVHVKPQQAYPFENVAGFDKNCVRNPTQKHDLDAVTEFVNRDDEPFCLVVALVEPHVPWVMGDASQYPPAKLKLPPHLVDTPVTRTAFSRYLAEITYMDGQVGELLDLLDRSGKAKNTFVLFSSEQGAQFPGSKWTNWDVGLHTALVARWPGHVEAGSRTNAIVQYADVAPTLVELAGGDPAKHGLDGRSFAKVLDDPSTGHRDHAFGIHNNVPEGPAYPIRSATDGEYRYIRNLDHGTIYIEKHLMGNRGGSKTVNPYWATWMSATFDDRNAERLVKRYMIRPREQLYHTAGDPYELENLAADPKYAEIKQRLAKELDAWLTEQKDPGAAMDTKEALGAARRGEHLH